MPVRQSSSPFRRGEYPVHAIRCDRLPDSSPQRQLFWEIVLVTGGAVSHRLDGADLNLQSGDVVVIKEREVHGYRDARDLSLFRVRFDFKKLGMDRWEIAATNGFKQLFMPRRGSSAISRSRLHLVEITFRNVIALIEEIQRCTREKAVGSQMLVEGHFRHLVVLLSRAYDENLRIHDESRLRLEKVMAFLEKNYAEPINCRKLAAGQGLSVRTFYRLFKQATGLAPLEYVIQRRLKHACELLRNTDQPVTQIAYASGFTDGNYFTREFRQVLGESPSAYRKRWAD